MFDWLAPFSTLSLMSYLCLALSLLSLWFPGKRPFTVTLFILAVGLGLFEQRLSLTGIFFIFIYGSLTWGMGRPSTQPLRWILGLLFLLFSLALTLHIVPGFNNLKVLDQVRLTPEAKPFGLYLNFDKPLIALYLFSWILSPARTWQEWKSIFKWAGICLFPCVLVLLGSGVATHYIELAPKFLPITPFFLIQNLLFTCLAEEALFRGFIQNKLALLFNKIAGGPYLALFLGALLFGLAHYKGGMIYVLLSTLAGVFYGLAYLKSKYVEAAVLTHWGVNALHIVFFTYPALQH